MTAAPTANGLRDVDPREPIHITGPIRNAAAGLAAILFGLSTTVLPAKASQVMMGLAYQPYVGQWSGSADNPFAAHRLYTPSFNSYLGGITTDDQEAGLWSARQHIRLSFDSEGRVSDISATGSLTFDSTALQGASPGQWSRRPFRFFDGATPQAAATLNHQGSVYRQLAYLAEQAGGAPLTLATYGTGFDVGYWRRLDEEDYAVFPVWAENRVDYIAEGSETPDVQRTADELLFYFPPEATFVIPAPERVVIETTGTPGLDLALEAVHLRVFEPARKGQPGAVMNPGFFLGDANAQVPLAAAEMNARAGQTLLTIKQGIPNLAVDGTLVNARMRFAIRSALAQAQVANARHPGTLTHLIVSNEYSEITEKAGDALTTTQQITEMVRFAREQMAPGGDFEGLGLAIGVRGHRFRGVDAKSTDPATRQFTQDVRELIKVTDVLMENIYPSAEAVELARASGDWSSFFDPDQGELSIQWRRLELAIAELADGKDVALMIGEIGHPTNGIAFNLPGYVIDGRPIAPGSAFKRVSDALAKDETRINPPGIETFQRYFNDRLSAAFLTEAFRWSRDQGVQIHAFEAFDEPHKSAQNLPLPSLSLAESTLNHTGSYGAEAFYGIFGYTGVASFSAAPAHPIKPGARLIDDLADGPDGEHIDWAPQFSGQLYRKLPGFDFTGTAKSFVPL
jgi:hypothetical protein